MENSLLFYFVLGFLCGSVGSLTTIILQRIFVSPKHDRGD